MSIEVKNVTKNFGPIRVLNNVNLRIDSGELVALLGPSGCGKTSLLRIIAGLETADFGSIYLEDDDATLTGARERQVGFVFQHYALFRHMSVFENVAFGLRVKPKKERPSEDKIREKVHELLDMVQLKFLKDRFPSQLSGGQRQRIGIARAIALKPRFIVADEPVSALDVSIQAQVINLLDDLKAEEKISMVFIAHDLSVVQHISDRVAVMYLGKIMELAPTADLYAKPHHPYTTALLSAVPLPDPRSERTRERIILQGDLPSPMNPPSGCVFRTRCWKAQSKCETEVPTLKNHGSLATACHFPE